MPIAKQPQQTWPAAPLHGARRGSRAPGDAEERRAIRDDIAPEKMQYQSVSRTEESQDCGKSTGSLPRRQRGRELSEKTNFDRVQTPELAPWPSIPPGGPPRKSTPRCTSVVWLVRFCSDTHPPQTLSYRPRLRDEFTGPSPGCGWPQREQRSAPSTWTVRSGTAEGTAAIGVFAPPSIRSAETGGAASGQPGVARSGVRQTDPGQQ